MRWLRFSYPRRSATPVSSFNETWYVPDGGTRGYKGIRKLIKEEQGNKYLLFPFNRQRSRWEVDGADVECCVCLVEEYEECDG